MDALILVTNAAGLSAFNPVERRMAPLSHDLSGLVLKHDTFGSHLDKNGKTIDTELEKKNFYAAAEVLSDVWSNTVIDKYPVICKVARKGSEFIPDQVSAGFLANHVRQSKYGCQIVKCLDINCCTPYKTKWREVFLKGFMPPPAIYKFGLNGKEIVEPSEYFENIENSNYKFATLNERLIHNLR